METLVRVDAIGLINLIVEAAQNATTHQKNCEQLAGHLRMIGNLLEKVKLTDLRNFPATGEPLDCLEEALSKALDLVVSCREKSYLYALAMGWSVVYQFREIQNEIDQYLKLVPFLALVHAYRIQFQNLKESLQAIEEDHREYTLDERDMEAQSVLLKRDRTKRDAVIVEKSLSRQYPELKFKEALQEEKEKLHVELQKARMNNDTKQCCVIEHLIGVTENVINAPPEKNLSLNADTCIGSRYGAAAKSSHGANELQSEDQAKSEWQADLFDCCAEPCLSLKTCIYPCGIFTQIVHVVSKGKIRLFLVLLFGTTARERAGSDLMAYSLFCGCFCYTCCMRRKLRKLFDIEGGPCDDFLTHLMCCCCAMVQEWRELELRGFEGGCIRTSSSSLLFHNHPKLNNQAIFTMIDTDFT